MEVYCAELKEKQGVYIDLDFGMGRERTFRLTDSLLMSHMATKRSDMENLIEAFCTIHEKYDENDFLVRKLSLKKCKTENELSRENPSKL